MKKTQIQRFAFAICLLLGTCFFSIAQKLPNKQEESLRVSRRIIIDGKMEDWNDKFMAYNRATEVFYSIANDENNVYLIVRAINPLVIRKIIAGNITFTISTYSHGKTEEPVKITYPLFSKDNSPGIYLKKAPSSENKLAIDSFVNAINKQFQSKAKQIGISGIKAIKDSSISVYNEQNIVATGIFDQQITYTYELSMPLKYLSISPEEKALSYNIKINGSPYAEGAFFERFPSGTTRIQAPTPYNVPSMADMILISSSTDVGGEYTLAK